MPRVRSGDAEIAYEVIGTGPPVVLLHPFPANHQLWLPAAQLLLPRYQVILPDLRGHGESGVGEDPATMEKHAADIGRIMDDAEIGRAPLAGISIGGYALFEFWRRSRGRVAALVLSNTRAQADTAEGRAGRLQTAAEVLEKGTGQFLEGLLPKLMGKTARETRPDLVEAARKMMLQMTPQALSLVQRGMAERPDSVPTLKSINVPCLVLAGDEDTLTPVADAELMRQNVSGSELKVVSRAGHYAAWEQPEEIGRILHRFLDSVHGA